MEQSKQGRDVVELMELVDHINERVIDNPNETSGPGAKKRNTPNDYTRQQVADMLQYASEFVKSGKQMESWPYDQEWLNKVGSTMKEFLTLKKGDPALNYEPGKMQGDHHAKPYSKTSYGSADKGKASADMKGEGPGPVRGKKMKSRSEYNPGEVTFSKWGKGKGRARGKEK
jgi:hypothetical protein